MNGDMVAPGTRAPAGVEKVGGGVAVTDLLKAVWRRRLWVVVPLVIVLAAVYLLLVRMQPLYTSSASILIEDTQSVFARAEQERGEAALADPAAIESNVQLLLSRDLAIQVVRDLGLTRLPEFDPLGAGVSPVTRLLVATGIRRDPRLLTPEERALKVYYDRLSVYRIGSSRVIAVVFTSRDPQLAARIANAVADTYMARQFEAKRESTQRAAEWLGEQVERLRGNVEAAEAKVEAFKSARGLQRGANDSSLLAQQLSELNSQLIVAKTRRAEAQARAQTIRELIRSGGDLGSASDVVGSQLIQRLLEQQVTLARRIAELTPTLLPQHPRMRELNAELADLKRQIRQEAEKIAQGLENEARVAGARENAVRSSLNALKQDVELAAEDEVELRTLEREARAQRDVLQSFLVRYREASARDDQQALPAAARIVSRASASNEPSFPKIGPILIIAALATLLVSAGGLVSAEVFNALHAVPGSVRAAAPAAAGQGEGEPPQEVPAPAVAVVQPERRGVSLPVETQDFPEAVRAVAAQIVARKGKDGRIRVLVTSPQRQTRDNAAAINVARLIAGLGLRTILIDANIRTPRLGVQVGVPGAPGFGEMLAGEASFAEVIRRDPLSSLHLICAGEARFDPLPLMQEERIERVLDALEGSYGVVLVDAPPVMLSPETRALGGHIDAAVLVGDELPGAQRLLDKARDLIAGQNRFPVEIVIAPPEIARPVAAPPAPRVVRAVA